MAQRENRQLRLEEDWRDSRDKAIGMSRTLASTESIQKEHSEQWVNTTYNAGSTEVEEVAVAGEEAEQVLAGRRDEREWLEGIEDTVVGMP